MERIPNDALKTMETINTYLDAHTAEWSTIPAITTYKDQLIHAIDALKAATPANDEANKLEDTDVQHLKITVAEKMDILDDILEAYADESGNPTLLGKAENSKTDYIRLSDEAFETKVKNVIELLETHVAHLADYGLTQDQIEDAKRSFSIYQDKQGSPRSYPMTTPTTQNLDSTLQDVAEILHELDEAMKGFKSSNSSFYDGYQAVRG